MHYHQADPGPRPTPLGLVVVVALALSAYAAARAQAHQARPAALRPEVDALPDTALARRLEQAAGRWEARGPAGYVLRYQVSCFCPPQPVIRVTVRGGVVSVLEEGTAVGDLPRPLTAGRTVPQLFGEARRQLADTGWTVVAEFDSVLGYPRLVSGSSRTMADVGSAIRVLSLEPVAD
ncbi:MAG: hypothetical protein KA180_09730 [Gemmatimonadales bacterium]|jgi:hypothetical protein|nr:hypothetical protein [Gemmatimonadales bacterium]